jgi:hypothetical protein
MSFRCRSEIQKCFPLSSSTFNCFNLLILLLFWLPEFHLWCSSSGRSTRVRLSCQLSCAFIYLCGSFFLHVPWLIMDPWLCCFVSRVRVIIMVFGVWVIKIWLDKEKFCAVLCKVFYFEGEVKGNLAWDFWLM